MRFLLNRWISTFKCTAAVKCPFLDTVLYSGKAPLSGYTAAVITGYSLVKVLLER